MTPAKQERFITQHEYDELQRNLDTERRVNAQLAKGQVSRIEYIVELEAERDALKAELAQSVKFGANELSMCARLVLEKREAEAELAETEKALTESESLVREWIAAHSAAEAKLEGMRRALEVVEWRASGAHYICLWCSGSKEYGGHKPDCQRQAALDGGKEGE